MKCALHDPLADGVLVLCTPSELTAHLLTSKLCVCACACVRACTCVHAYVCGCLCVGAHTYYAYVCTSMYYYCSISYRNKQEVHGKYQLDDHMSHLVCCYGVWDHSITDIVTLFATMYPHSDKVLFSLPINSSFNKSSLD